MLFTAIFVITLSWRIARGLQNGTTESSLFIHPSSFKKAAVEIVIPKKQVLEKDETTVDLMEYLKERKSQHKKKKVQQITLTSLPGAEVADIYLN